MINIIDPDCPMGNMKMARFCPKAMTTESTGDEEEDKCSCLQTLVAEQAV